MGKHYTPQAQQRQTPERFCSLSVLMCCLLAPALLKAAEPINRPNPANELAAKALKEWLAASNDLHRVSMKYPEVFAAERAWQEADKAHTTAIVEETSEAKKLQQEIRDRLEKLREQRLQENPEFVRAQRAGWQVQGERHTNNFRIFTLQKELAQATNANSKTEQERAKSIADLTRQLAAAKEIAAEIQQRSDEASGVIGRIQREVARLPELHELEMLYGKTMYQNWDAWSENERINRALKERNEKLDRYKELVKKHPEVSVAKQRADLAREKYEKHR